MMKTENKKASDLSLWEATTVNGKVVAAYGAIGIGYGVGGFKSIAGSAMTHAAKHKGGHVDKLLTKGILDHYKDSAEEGFHLMERGKDLIDFDFNIGTPSKTNDNSSTNNTNTKD